MMTSRFVSLTEEMLAELGHRVTTAEKKLYPPGPDARGWVLDDEKNTYPLFEVLRRHGVRNVCVHKGLPGIFLEQYCHTDDLARAAAAFLT
jgi:uncharacterized protein